jgi:MTH538 TIR-like domain (DUF1863)
MARRVFFSFHYGRDIWRVNVVRNTGAIEGVAAAGFHDASLWEETKRRGGDAVRRLIDRGLEGTSVTVVLIGAETAQRLYVTYEIAKSISRGNGLLGILIHNIKDELGRPGIQGRVPEALRKAGAPVYTWEYGRLGQWVEAAYKAAHPNG